MNTSIGTLICLCVIITCEYLPAQSLLESRHNPWKVSLGVQWQGGISENLWNLSHIVQARLPSQCRYCIPYRYEKNIQGIGFTAGIAIKTKNLVEFFYAPVFRYDEIHWQSLPARTDYQKAFIIHHRLGLNKLFRNKSNAINQYMGASFMVLNTGKKFNYYDNFREQNTTLDLQFPSVTFAYGHALYKKLFGEFQVYYLYNGLPHNKTRHYFMYGLQVYYNVEFQMKKLLDGKKKKTDPIKTNADT